MAGNNTHLKYLTVNDTDKKWGLYVSTVGFQKAEPFLPYPPEGHPGAYMFDPLAGRRLPEFQLIYVTQGEGKLRTKANMRGYPLRAGSLFMLFPDVWHSYIPKKQTGWSAYWIGFDGDFVRRGDFTNFFTPEKPVMEIGLSDTLVNLFTEAISVAGFQMAGFQQVLSGIIIHLLGKIYSLEQNLQFEGSEIRRQVDKAKVFILENIENALAPQMVSEELHIGYPGFRKAFKKYTGLAPGEYIRQLKIQKAKELLLTTTLSVKEISARLHFESNAYFSTFFRKETGMTPIGFLEKNRGF